MVSVMTPTTEPSASQTTTRLIWLDDSLAHFGQQGICADLQQPGTRHRGQAADRDMDHRAGFRNGDRWALKHVESFAVRFVTR
jgi:hypothetical protein